MSMPIFPEETKTIRLAAGTLHYREVGKGDPIVFIHGLLVNSLLWRKVVPFLADEFRCIIPDLPLGGHPEPMSAEADLSLRGLADLIGEFIDALGPGKATVVANDTGGALAQITAVRHPERISRLILTNCDAFENFLPPLFRFLQTRSKIPGYIFLLTQALRVRKVRRMPKAFGRLAKHPIPDGILDRFLLPALRIPGVRRDLRKVLMRISSQETVDAAKSFHLFRRPVLLAWAHEDKVFPKQHARMLADLFPDARIVDIEDSWAFVPEDQPEKLSRAMQLFLHDTSVKTDQVRHPA
jgi:pimeloyl-ACP methyl ester carboxylesterase